MRTPGWPVVALLTLLLLARSTAGRDRDLPADAAAAADAHAFGVAGLLEAAGSPEGVRRAIGLLERAVLLDPAHRGHRLDLADAYLALGLAGTAALALDLLEDLWADDPADDLPLGPMVEAWQRLGREDRALATARLRVETAGDRADRRREAALQLALLAFEDDRAREAASALQQSLERHGEDPAVRVLLGELRLAAGDPAGAAREARAVLAAPGPDGRLEHAAADLLARSRP